MQITIKLWSAFLKAEPIPIEDQCVHTLLDFYSPSRLIIALQNYR